MRDLCPKFALSREGFSALEAKLPFLCTTSVKASSIKKYPSQIVPGLLYLGNWEHAEAVEDLDEIKVKKWVGDSNS